MRGTHRPSWRSQSRRPLPVYPCVLRLRHELAQEPDPPGELRPSHDHLVTVERRYAIGGLVPLRVAEDTDERDGLVRGIGVARHRIGYGTCVALNGRELQLDLVVPRVQHANGPLIDVEYGRDLRAG